jgi:putative ABC transport system permease protein
MISLLNRSSLRYLRRHPWLVALSILGVAVGVAVVVAIDLANASAARAFTMSTDAVAGRATHVVHSDGGTLSEDVYRLVRVEAGIRKSAPIIEGYAAVEGRTMHVLGIDPLAEAPFRAYTSEQSFDLGGFIAGVSALLSAETARDLAVMPGDSLTLSIDGQRRLVAILDTIAPADDSARRGLENLMLVDISTAQSLFGMEGRISHIDLLLEDASEAQLREIQQRLPAGVTVGRSEARTQIVEEMTRAFELNLSALSLLALVVGMFLIYNTMTFSVVQRRTALGRLRALGVTDLEVIRLVMVEAALIGLVGTAIGVVAGILLAGGLVDLVAQTINDLYFAVSVRTIAVDPFVLAKGAVLGLSATLIAAAVPAVEAARAPASVTLQRSVEETRLRSRAPYYAIGGLIAVGMGVVVLLVSGRSIVWSYAGMLLLIAGASLFTPIAVMSFSRIVRGPAGHLFGLTGRMAARGIVSTMSRLAIAVAALMVAIAATIGVGVMIDSFRQTVDVWLTQTLQADIYIQPPGLGARLGEGNLRQAVVERVREHPSVDGAYTVRTRRLTEEGRAFNLVAIDPGPEEGANYRFMQGSRADVWPHFVSGDAVLVSEPFSYRFGLGVGDSVRIRTDRGPALLPIGGVYFDYGSDLGNIVLSRAGYEARFDDSGYSGVSVRLAPEADVDGMVGELRRLLESEQEVIIRSNRGLREASLDVFDRTFTITHVLRLLTVLVAFIGVLTALMALQLERRREMAVMRAQGFSPRQIWNYVTLQSGLAGFLAALLALPLGLALATVLVYVINKRSFGWTLQFTIAPEILVQALVVGTVAAVLAAMVPSWKMARADAASALREE